MIERLFLRAKLVAFFAVLLVLFVISPTKAQTTLSESERMAAAFVQAFSDQAVSILQDETLADEEQTILFRAMLVEGFDTDRAARFSISRGWRQLSPEQRETYVALFRDDLINLGLGFFADYEGENLVVERSVARKENEFYVYTRLSDPDVAIDNIDFQVAKTPEGHRILDIELEGFSILHSYRSNFIEHLFRGGVEAVISHLETRARRQRVEQTAGDPARDG